MPAPPLQSFLPLKTPVEIAALRAAGLINWHAHRLAESLLAPGTLPSAVDFAIEAWLERTGAEPLFRGVVGSDGQPYPAVSCISVNDGVVHGIPHDVPLRNGDVVTIDVGCRFHGWCADSAETHIVGAGTAVARRLVRDTRHVLSLAIESIPRARYWSEVVEKIDAFMASCGLRMIAPVFGHGIGRELHEPPQVPLTLRSPLVHFVDFELEPGIVFTVEPVLTTGSGTLRLADDRWTLATADGHLAAHVEHTIAITELDVQVLTEGDGRLPAPRPRSSRGKARP